MLSSTATCRLWLSTQPANTFDRLMTIPRDVFDQLSIAFMLARSANGSADLSKQLDGDYRGPPRTLSSSGFMAHQLSAINASDSRPSSPLVPQGSRTQ